LEPSVGTTGAATLRGTVSNQSHRVVARGKTAERRMVLRGKAGHNRSTLKPAFRRVERDFPGSGPASTSESAAIYAADWHDATSVCTPEGYHEHYEGELALLVPAARTAGLSRGSL
jgi:hypothetical protein